MKNIIFDVFDESGVRIFNTNAIKTGMVNRENVHFQFPYFRGSKLCIPSALEAYITRTTKLRLGSYILPFLFLRSQEAFKRSTRAMLSKWIK